MVLYADDGILRFMTPLAAKCMRNNLSKTYPGRDLTGERFGQLIALKRTRSANNRWLWKCVCDCGQTCQAVSYNLTSGGTQSCGCLRKKTGRENGKATGKANLGKRWQWKARKAAA